MMKTLTLATTAIAMTVSGLAATPAAAQRYYDQGQTYGYDQRGYDRVDDRQYDRQYDRDYDQSRYQDRQYRRQYRDSAYPTQQYQDRRFYNQSQNRCNSGSGTIIGAIAGGLLGNVIAGRGDRTLGTVLGAGGGALAGNAIQKDGCR